MKRLFAVLALLFALPAWGANVTATTGWATKADSSSLNGTSPTIDAGSNRKFVIFYLDRNATDPTTPGCTVGGQAATEAFKFWDNPHTLILFIWNEAAVAAMSGSTVATCDFSSNDNYYLYGTLENTNQTNLSGYSGTDIDGDLSITTTSSSGDLIVCGAMEEDETTSFTSWDTLSELLDVASPTDTTIGGFAAGNGGDSPTSIDILAPSIDGGACAVFSNTSATPTFTSAPAIGTRTISTIPVNFTSDTTGTVHGAALADGNTCTCDAIEAETCTGGYRYFHEAVVAAVADTGTFSSYTDGTVRDGKFCIEDGSGNDSTVASIADMFKIPAFTTLLTIASQTNQAYTSNSKVLDGAGLVDLVACAKDASPPSVAQVQAGTGGCIVNAIEDDATGAQTLTITLNPAFPLYDLYYVGSYGGQSEAAVHALLDEFLDPPTGKLFQTLASVHANSPCFGATPAVAAGDILVIDSVTNIKGYVVTPFDSCLFSIAAGGDTSFDTIDVNVYGVGLANYHGQVTYPLNNLAPEPQSGNPFANPYLFQINAAITSFDLLPFAPDPEGHVVVVTALEALPTGLSITASGNYPLVGTPTACTSNLLTDIQWEDEWDATYVAEANISIGPLVPNVANLAEATAITTIETTCSLDAIAGTPHSSSTIAEGNVISTNPAIGTLVVPTQQVTYSLSLGPGGSKLNFGLGLGL